jgi:hypothetical protein
VTIETSLIENDERLQKAVTATRQKWLPVVRSAYGIPDVIGESMALAAIAARVRIDLEASEIPPPNQIPAAQRVLAATLELLHTGELDDCLLPKELAQLLADVPDPAARIASQSGITGQTSATGTAAMEAAKNVFERVAKEVGTLPRKSRVVVLT